MEENDLAQIQRFCDQSPRYRRLYEEHELLEKELETLDHKEYLTPEEELQRKKIQKLKLAGKDEMAHIMRAWQQ